MDKDVITRKTSDLSTAECKQLIERLSDEFENDYLRKMHSQLSVFKHKDYRMSYIGGKGFILWWEFDDLVFIEYLLVCKQYRNQGFGSKLLNAVKQLNRVVILEVESENKSLKHFYSKNGFKESAIKYEPIQINEGVQCGLELMSFNHELSIQEYDLFISIISADELQF